MKKLLLILMMPFAGYGQTNFIPFDSTKCDNKAVFVKITNCLSGHGLMSWPGDTSNIIFWSDGTISIEGDTMEAIRLLIKNRERSEGYMQEKIDYLRKENDDLLLVIGKMYNILSPPSIWHGFAGRGSK